MLLALAHHYAGLVSQRHSEPRSVVHLSVMSVYAVGLLQFSHTQERNSCMICPRDGYWYPSHPQDLTCM